MKNGTQVKTCSPALGNSFAAGTMDGRGMSGFSQGGRGVASTPWYSGLLTNLVLQPSEELKTCQHPKPVLIPTGEVRMNFECLKIIYLACLKRSYHSPTITFFCVVFLDSRGFFRVKMSIFHNFLTYR